jgi:hypothetical protein
MIHPPAIAAAYRRLAKHAQERTARKKAQRELASSAQQTKEEVCICLGARLRRSFDIGWLRPTDRFARV